MNNTEKENNPCLNCDSKSMEECLLIRKCENWIKKNKNK